MFKSILFPMILYYRLSLYLILKGNFSRCRDVRNKLIWTAALCIGNYY